MFMTSYKKLAIVWLSLNRFMNVFSGKEGWMRFALRSINNTVELSYNHGLYRVKLLYDIVSYFVWKSQNVQKRLMSNGPMISLQCIFFSVFLWNGTAFSGKVFVDGKMVDKAGTPVSEKANVEILAEVPKYVCRWWSLYNTRSFQS